MVLYSELNSFHNSKLKSNWTRTELNVPVKSALSLPTEFDSVLSNCDQNCGKNQVHEQRYQCIIWWKTMIVLYEKAHSKSWEPCGLNQVYVVLHKTTPKHNIVPWLEFGPKKFRRHNFNSSVAILQTEAKWELFRMWWHSPHEWLMPFSQNISPHRSSAPFSLFCTCLALLLSVRQLWNIRPPQTFSRVLDFLAFRTMNQNKLLFQS